MEFEWDENKRAINLRVHGLDFTRATTLFDGRPMYTYLSPRGGEERSVSIAIEGEKFFAVVWTERNQTTRIIPFRRARDAEERKYRAVYG